MTIRLFVTTHVDVYYPILLTKVTKSTVDVVLWYYTGPDIFIRHEVNYIYLKRQMCEISIVQRYHVIMPATSLLRYT